MDQRLSLEEAIEKEPDNPELYLVYADWLQSNGDPLGEWISLHDGLRRAPENKNIKRKLDALSAQHPDELIGPLAAALQIKRGYKQDTDAVSVQTFMGFIKSVDIETGYYDRSDEKRGTEQAAEIVRSMLTHRTGRFIQSLRVGDVWMDGEADFSPIASAVGANAPCLRELTIERTDLDISSTFLSFGDASPLNGSCPYLQKLELEAGDITLGRVNLPEARQVYIRSGGLPHECITDAANAVWPKLEALHIWFGCDEYGGTGGVSHIKKILDGEGLPELSELGLMNAECTDEICHALAGSRIAAQLERVNLSMGWMTDNGAKALAVAGKKAFPRLIHIDVRDSFIGAEGLAALQTLCDSVQAKGQDEFNPEEPRRRYTQVSE